AFGSPSQSLLLLSQKLSTSRQIIAITSVPLGPVRGGFFLLPLPKSAVTFSGAEALERLVPLWRFVGIALACESPSASRKLRMPSADAGPSPFPAPTVRG